jgi:hypothetical protein
VVVFELSVTIIVIYELPVMLMNYL